MSVLRFDNVSKQYHGGHQALSEVSFEVAAGEMLFVTGHSGAGKSTLLKLIHLSERPSRGAVLFGERNLLKVRGRRVALHRRDVGVVFQDHRLLADRSVEDNVGLPLLLRGLRRGDIAKRVRVALDKVGLGGRARALPTQLSAGEQQRVGIARAIVAEPRLLVADEPTGNLDPTLSAEIMALFESLPERGTSVLVASHDLALVRRMKKRVLVLNEGRLVDDIAPQDLAQGAPASTPPTPAGSLRRGAPRPAARRLASRNRRSPCGSTTTSTASSPASDGCCASRGRPRSRSA